MTPGRSRSPGLARVLAIGILATWLVVLGWHVRREYFRPASEVLAMGARSLGPGTHFYGIRMGEATVGMATARVDTLADGFRLEDLMLLDIPAAGQTHRATVRTEAVLGPSLELRSFAFTLDSEIGEFRVLGEAGPDSTVVVRLEGDGPGSSTPEFTLDPGTILPVTLPLRLAASGRLEVGRELEVQLFDPSVLERRDLTIRVTDHDTLVVPDSVHRESATSKWRIATHDTVPAWRVEQTFGGTTLASWLDEDGRLVSAESPLGFSVERTAYDLVRSDWDASRRDPALAAGYGTIIESTAISSNVSMEGATDLDSLAVRLRHVDPEGFDLSGDGQELRGDTLVVRRESGGGLAASYQLPWDDGGAPAAQLAAEPLIQTDDPAIVAAARRIVGEEADPVRAARLINDWVYRELDKEIVPSIPSALQVLEARRGDCNEHTVLFVALARSIGLPTRTAVGLVNVDESFYYHAWPEVWSGSRWLAVDPTLGQFPADATHLRFLIGGLARQVELLRLIGRLRLEVV